MAITPYDRPAQQPIMDTFTPIPFQEMVQAGAMTQARQVENQTLESDLSNQVMQLDAIDKVNLPGLSGQSIKMGDLNAVKSLQDKWDQQLQEVTSSIPDASSPERTAKLRAIAMDMKRQLGPNGTAGIAAHNLNVVNNFNKMLRDNPKLANSPQMVPFINALKQHELDTRDGNIKKLDLSGAPGEDIDISERLTDLLKNYGEKAGVPGIRSVQGFDGVIQQLQGSKIDPKEIANTVLEYMTTDPMIKTQIGLQSQFDQMKGINTTPGDLIKSYADIMGQVFSKSDIKSSLTTDPSYSRRMDKQEEIDNLLSFDVATFKPGSGIASPAKLAEGKEAVTTQIQSYKEQMLTDENLKGLQVTENGMPADYKVNGVDKTDYIRKYYLEPIRLANVKLGSLKEFEERGKKEVGFIDPINISDSEIKQLPEFERIKEEVISDRNAMLFDPRITQGQKVDLTMTSEEIEDTAVERLKGVKRTGVKGYSEWKDWLEKENKSGSFIVGVKPLTKTLSSNLENHLLSNYANKETSIGKIESILSQNKGKVYGKEDFKKISISKDTPPVFEGYTVNSEGQGKLVYTVKDADNKPVDKVAIDAPQSFTQDLFKKGLMDEFAYMVNAEVSGETKAFGNLITNQTLSLDPYSYEGKYSNDNPVPTIEIRRDTSMGDERITGTVTVEGQPTEVTFNSKAELDTWIANFRKVKATRNPKE